MSERVFPTYDFSERGAHASGCTGASPDEGCEAGGPQDERAWYNITIARYSRYSRRGRCTASNRSMCRSSSGPPCPQHALRIPRIASCDVHTTSATQSTTGTEQNRSSTKPACISLHRLSSLSQSVSPSVSPPVSPPVTLVCLPACLYVSLCDRRSYTTTPLVCYTDHCFSHLG